MKTQPTTASAVLKKREVVSLAVDRPRTNQYGNRDTITTSGTTCGITRR